MARDRRWDAVPPLRYDGNELKSRVGFREAFEYYTGMAYQKGKQVRCFESDSHKNGDKNPSMHLYDNNCFCFSCGKSYDIFGLAARSKGLDLQSDFPAVCETLCQDFNIDPYVVSNLAERESAIEQVFGEGVQKKEDYKEYFPLSSADLTTIGFHESNGRQEMLFSISAIDYYINAYFDRADEKKFGKTAGELTPEERAAYIDELPKRIKEHLFDANGKPAIMQVTYQEAIDIGNSINSDYLYIKDLVENSGGKINEKGHAFLPVHRVSDLWNDDKKSTEEMIFNKIGETNDYLNYKICALESSRKNYESSHDLDREEKLFELYITTVSGKNSDVVYWTEAQKQRIQEFVDYKNDGVEMQCCKDAMKNVEKVYEKMNNFLIRRVEFEVEYGDVSDKKPNDTPDMP